MNIAFFLLPKNEVVYLSPRSTLRQALERMERHRYTAVPLVDEEGHYAGTLTEGDLLWFLKRTAGVSFDDSEHIRLSQIPQHMQNEPVSIYADMKDLVQLAAVQNFVPVVDDRKLFIGIVRRRDIIEYCAKLLFGQKEETGATTRSAATDTPPARASSQ